MVSTRVPATREDEAGFSMGFIAFSIVSKEVLLLSQWFSMNVSAAGGALGQGFNFKFDVKPLVKARPQLRWIKDSVDFRLVKFEVFRDSTESEMHT